MPDGHVDQVVRPQHWPRRLARRLFVTVVAAGVLSNCVPTVEADRSGLSAATASDRTERTTSKEYRIEAIRAYLWHEELARLSTADALALPAGTLWNTPFGADRVPSSRATLVVVEVSGPSDAAVPRRWLDFSATARLRDGRRRLLLRHSIPIVKVIDQGSWHVPFLLHDTGCVPVELHAEIRGQQRKSRADRLLDFRCGE
jgi:hypothetical protein